MPNSNSESIFEVKFSGPGIDPGTIPLRTVSEVLTAIQDIVSGRDPYETRNVPVEKSIGLVRVKKGSAIYRMLAHDPIEAFRNIAKVATLLAAISNPSLIENEPQNEDLVTVLTPIKKLSRISQKIGCRLEVTIPSKQREPFFTVEHDDFEKISERLFVSGNSTVIGIVERVGGATGMRCVMRVPARSRLLYCDVETRDVSRALGQLLYHPIIASGTAIWLHSTWRMYQFKIKSVSKCPKFGDPTAAIEELRNAGLDAWDRIEDPYAFLRE